MNDRRLFKKWLNEITKEIIKTKRKNKRSFTERRKLCNFASPVNGNSGVSQFGDTENMVI